MFNTEGVQQTLYIPRSLPRHRYDLNTPETEATKLFHHAWQRWDANHQSCLQQRSLQVRWNHLYIILNAMATGKMQHAKGVVVKEGTRVRLSRKSTQKIQRCK